ncbi:MAG: dolichyl-phosphate beta-glucosyltransferase [archaeon]
MVYLKYSIIVPMYNEEKRFNSFIPKLSNFLSKNLKDYELIFVNDGSKDRTLEILKRLECKNKVIVTYQVNHGKGYAVKKGILSAKGDYILFIDADGSIPTQEIPRMFEKLKNYDVVIGDREQARSVVKRSFTRKITSFLFNNYSRLLFDTNVIDHLCGFKGFRRKVALSLFKNLKSNRWIFDVEILCKIKKEGYSLYRLPINWIHKGDSKMKFLDPLKIFFDLINLRMKI